MNDNTIESVKWHKDQLSKLLNEDDFYKVESEIDSMLEKGTQKVLVRRGGKTFYREQKKGEEKVKEPPKITSVRPINKALKAAGLEQGKSSSMGSIGGRSLATVGKGFETSYDKFDKTYTVSYSWGMKYAPSESEKADTNKKMETALSDAGIEYKVYPWGLEIKKE